MTLMRKAFFVLLVVVLMAMTCVAFVFFKLQFLSFEGLAFTASISFILIAGYEAISIF